MSRSLGESIRQQRLGLGLSLGQLATRAGTSPSVVRSWERGRSIPDEGAAGVLAELLGIDPADFTAALAAGPPVDDGPADPPVVEADAGEIADQVAAVTEPVPDGEPAPSEEALFSQVAMSFDLPDAKPPQAGGPGQATAADGIEPDAGVEQSSTRPPPAPGEQAPGPLPGLDPGGVAAPDPNAPRPVPLRYPQSAPAGVAVEVTETEQNVWNPLRYLYDPDKPWLYWIRAAATVLILLVLFNILFDSVGELFDKIGELLDTLDFGGGGDEDPTSTTIET